MAVGIAGLRHEVCCGSRAAQNSHNKLHSQIKQYRIVRWLFLLFTVLAVVGCNQPRDPDKHCEDVQPTKGIRTTTHCMSLRTFSSRNITARPTLVAVLHGDLWSPPPTYHYEAARRVAERHDNIIAVGILRPGYSDGQGASSTGQRGQATGDNYTTSVVDAVAETLMQLREHHDADKILVVGHSGGAAIAALIASRHHGVLNHIVLVGCPCDVWEWREHMRSLHPNVDWTTPVESLSPFDLAASFDPNVSAWVMVGNNDHVAPARLSNAYVEALQNNGKAAQLIRVPAKGHNILLDPEVSAIIDEMIEDDAG